MEHLSTISILNLLKSFFKRFTRKPRQKNTIGIDNKGNDNTFSNNKINGFDIGIRNNGKRTQVNGNDISGPLDQQKHDKQWYKTGWGQISIGIIVAILSAVIMKHILHI